MSAYACVCVCVRMGRGGNIAICYTSIIYVLETFQSLKDEASHLVENIQVGSRSVNISEYTSISDVCLHPWLAYEHYALCDKHKAEFSSDSPRFNIIEAFLRKFPLPYNASMNRKEILSRIMISQSLYFVGMFIYVAVYRSNYVCMCFYWSFIS